MSENSAPMVWPTLRARDARGLIRFLVEAFGFEEVVVYGDADDGQVAHAELLWPVGGGIMLGSAGASVLRAPEDTDYGSRECAVRDPEGNRWSFGTYRGQPRRV